MRISFERRSSRFSRSSSAIRALSSLVVPGRKPLSTSTCGSLRDLGTYAEQGKGATAGH
ncbi:MAG: hypothetical protein LC792_16425 [Actinobacteria bacterium]|nr:hypothetical protein [Actinomycetota bacterium]